MDPQLLSYYEAIETASADMLAAARAGNWDEVVKLEGACVLLISKLKHAAQQREDEADAARSAHAANAVLAAGTSDRGRRSTDPVFDARQLAKAKSRIMQRILVNDAEIRQLAEPWLQELDETMAGRSAKVLH